MRGEDSSSWPGEFLSLDFGTTRAAHGRDMCLRAIEGEIILKRALKEGGDLRSASLQGNFTGWSNLFAVGYPFNISVKHPPVNPFNGYRRLGVKRLNSRCLTSTRGRNEV